MTQANERMLEHLSRARDADDELAAALRARLREEDEPGLRSRLLRRLREVEATRAAVESRRAALSTRRSPAELGLSLATLPWRLGAAAARNAVGGALSLVLGALGLDGGGADEAALRERAAEERSLAVFAALARVARMQGDDLTEAVAGRAGASAERTLAEERAAEGSAAEAAVRSGAEAAVPEPWEGYRRMNAREVVSRLRRESDEAVAAAERYERLHGKRRTVLRAAERRLRGGGA
ncbi:MAG: hypothetical protein IRZ21_08455 [Thermoleophilaceae bacterium]|nr:hypothetical protein [Thermoleophilaceae bacterium]